MCTTRWSECVYTHRPVINQKYGCEKSNCRKCNICLGNLAYKIWYETYNLDGWIEELVSCKHGLSSFSFERITSEIRERMKEVNELKSQANAIIIK